MRTLNPPTLKTLHQGMSWGEKFGWYGMAFFIIKGTLWLLIPFIMYAGN